MSLQQARQQLQQARTQIAEQRSLAQSKESELTDAQKQIQEQQRKLSAQRVLRQLDRTGAVKRGVAVGRLGEADVQVQTGLGQIGEFKGQLDLAEQEVVKGEKQVRAYEQLESSIMRTFRRQQEKGVIGATFGTDVQAVKKAFSDAGLDPKEGERIYRKTVTEVGGVQTLWSEPSMSKIGGGTDSIYLGTRDLRTGEVKTAEGITLDKETFTFSLAPSKGDRNLQQKIDIPSVTIPEASRIGMTGFSVRQITPTGKDGLSDYSLMTPIPKKTPIEKLRETFKSPLSVTQKFSDFTQFVGKGIEKGAEKITGSLVSGTFTLTGKDKGISPRYYGEKIGQVIERPSLLKDYFRGGKPNIVIDLNTGVAREATKSDFSKQVVVPSRFEVTKQEATEGGKFVGRTTGQIGKYFIPVAGAGFFGADVEQEFRKYDYSPKRFAKEDPVQAGITGGALILGGGIGLTMTGRAIARDVKYGRYIKPEGRGSQIVYGEEVMSVNPMTGTRDIPKVSGKKTDDLTNLYLKKTPKGRDDAFEYYGKPEVPLKVIEKLEVPKTSIGGIPLTTPLSVMRGKQLKTFKGEGILTKEGMKTIVVYGDKLKAGTLFKVTEIGKTGEGTIKLFRKSRWGDDKLVMSAKTGKPSAQRGIGKRKVEKAKIDEQVSEPFKVIETQKGGGAVKRKVKTREGDEVVDLFGKPIKTDLKSTKFLGESERTVKETGDISKGLFKLEVQDYVWSDIITTGARKGRITIKTPKGKVDIKKQVGQDIVVGTPKDVDITTTQVLGKVKIDKKSISPKVDRVVEEGTQFRFAQLMVDPKSKTLDPAKEFAKIRRKEIKKQVREIEKLEKQFQKAKASEQRSIQLRNVKDRLSNLKDRLSSVREKPVASVTYEAPSYTGGGQLVQAPPRADVVLPKDAFKLELAEQVIVAPPVLKGAEAFKQSAKPISYEITGVTGKTKAPFVAQVRTETPLATRQESVTALKTETKQDTVLRLDTKVALQTRTDAKLDTKSRQDVAQAQVPLLKTLLKTTTKTDTLLRQRTTTTPRQPRPPRQPKKPIIPKLPSSKQPLTKRLASRIDDAGVFKVFVRKKGEDIELGVFGTKEEAKKALRRKISGTLRASGFIETKGEKVQLDPSQFGAGFVKGKKDPFRIVEVREKRLKRGTSEVSEIQAFKKTKRSKKNVFGL